MIEYLVQLYLFMPVQLLWEHALVHVGGIAIRLLTLCSGITRYVGSGPTRFVFVPLTVRYSATVREHGGTREPLCITSPTRGLSRSGPAALHNCGSFLSSLTLSPSPPPTEMYAMQACYRTGGFAHRYPALSVDELLQALVRGRVSESSPSTNHRPFPPLSPCDPCLVLSTPPSCNVPSSLIRVPTSVPFAFRAWSMPC